MSDNEQSQELAVGETEPGQALQARVTELESLLAAKGEELDGARARVAELEVLVTGAEGERDRFQESLANAVSCYRALVVRDNPDILEEMIYGDGIEAVDVSLASARELVGRVRSGLEAEIAVARVPAGAPQRAPVDLSALTPREKIQYGIGGST